MLPLTITGINTWRQKEVGVKVRKQTLNKVIREKKEGTKSAN
jgi:hypothetical protein